MLGQMMPDALEKLKAETPRSARQGCPGPDLSKGKLL